MSDFKKLMAVDGLDIKDTTANYEKKKNYYDTKIIIRDDRTKEVLFKGKNKVVLSGGDIVAKKLFDIDADTIIPTYNTELSLNNGPNTTISSYNFPNTSFTGTAAKKNDPKILLFCIGTDGCGESGSQIYTVDYNSRINPKALIPFRFIPASSSLEPATLADETYFGSKTVTTGGNNFTAYYFKAFDKAPKLYRQYTDGAAIASNVYESGNTEVDCFVELTLKITKEEMREYFTATVGLDQCRFNTISLCAAYPLRKNDQHTYMQDIRPVTKLNISNEYMIDVTKGVEIIYQIYF